MVNIYNLKLENTTNINDLAWFDLVWGWGWGLCLFREIVCQHNTEYILQKIVLNAHMVRFSIILIPSHMNQPLTLQGNKNRERIPSNMFPLLRFHRDHKNRDTLPILIHNCLLATILSKTTQPAWICNCIIT